MASSRAGRMPCLRRASSITANTRCARPRNTWRAAESKLGYSSGSEPDVAGATPNTTLMNESWLNKVNWAQDGLVPVVTQEAGSGRVLTVAGMNREALRKTVQTG